MSTAQEKLEDDTQARCAQQDAELFFGTTPIVPGVPQRSANMVDQVLCSPSYIDALKASIPESGEMYSALGLIGIEIKPLSRKMEDVLKDSHRGMCRCAGKPQPTGLVVLGMGKGMVIILDFGTIQVVQP